MRPPPDQIKIEEPCIRGDGQVAVTVDGLCEVDRQYRNYQSEILGAPWEFTDRPDCRCCGTCLHRMGP